MTAWWISSCNREIYYIHGFHYFRVDLVVIFPIFIESNTKVWINSFLSLITSWSTLMKVIHFLYIYFKFPSFVFLLKCTFHVFLVVSVPGTHNFFVGNCWMYKHESSLMGMPMALHLFFHNFNAWLTNILNNVGDK